MRASKLSRFGRRRFLKALSSLGVTGVALNSATKDALAESEIDLDHEIPILRGWKHVNPTRHPSREASPEREPVYVGVPKEQWRRVESARDAANQLQENLGELGVEVGVRTSSSGQKEIVVKYPIEESPFGSDYKPETPIDRLRERVPSSVTGVAGRGTQRAERVEDIPVVVEKERVELQSQSYYYDCNYRPLGAGCAWRTEEGNPCTIGTPVYDNHASEWRLLTAAHCFMSYDAVECRQNSGSSDYVGTRVANKTEFDHPPNLFDASVIDLASASTCLDFASSQCDSYRGDVIIGTASKQRLHYLEDNGIDVYKQGARTGRTSGPITEVRSTSIRVDTTYGGGDSGCPFFEYQDGYKAWIAGILRGGTGDAQVTHMPEIEDRYNVEV